MSHFTVVEIEATDASCLIEALEALGYEGKIEVHDRPVTLIGYDGRPRLLDGQEVRAEIVICRQHLWEAALLAIVRQQRQIEPSANVKSPRWVDAAEMIRAFRIDRVTS
jgi:hypothetical protein